MPHVRLKSSQVKSSQVKSSQVKSSQVKSSLNRLLKGRHCRFAGLCLYWVLKGFYFLLIWPYFEAFSGLFEDFGKWLDNRMQRWRTEGFTLIEMSMVLVIIGLLVGGVLVGQDLVKAAETRAQITQVQKFDSAVNTFKNKYNGIPGDLDPTSASNFGFNVGAGCTGNAQGQRNGDGLLDGANGYPFDEAAGEVLLFWQDLSSANMIDGIYPNGGAAAATCNSNVTLSSTQMGQYFPAAKIGGGNYLYVYENNGSNWFGLSAANQVVSYGALYGTTSISVSQAYNIDKKIDDGLPTTGHVQAVYVNGWVAPGNTTPANSTNQPNDNPTTCYNTTYNTYSTGYKNGSGPNCALSFQMQGAAR